MEKYPTIAPQNKVEKAEGIQNLMYGDIVSPHFCWSVVGTPGSGKTSFIQQLLNNESLYKDKFDYVLVSSPSPIHI